MIFIPIVIISGMLIMSTYFIVTIFMDTCKFNKVESLDP